VKSFVDTNVLIYAYDLDAGARHERAKAVLKDLWKSEQGVVSTQVLQESYVNVTRKMAGPLSFVDARRIMENYLSWPVSKAF